MKGMMLFMTTLNPLVLIKLMLMSLELVLFLLLFLIKQSNLNNLNCEWALCKLNWIMIVHVGNLQNIFHPRGKQRFSWQGNLSGITVRLMVQSIHI